LVAAGLASAQFEADPLTNPGAVYELEGYSVQVPKGEGWFLMHHTAQSVLFGRRKASSTHAFVATAVGQKISPPITTPQQFLTFVKATHAESADPSREVILKNEVQIDSATKALCVRYQIETEDHGAPNMPKTALLMINEGETCVHPAIPNLVIDVGYSERGTAAEMKNGLQPAGEAFIKGLKFTAAKDKIED
jgi:hypothetical protein